MAALERAAAASVEEEEHEVVAVPESSAMTLARHPEQLFERGDSPRRHGRDGERLILPPITLTLCTITAVVQRENRKSAIP